MTNHGRLIFQVDIRFDLMNFYNSFYDILHLFNLQDPSGFLKN
jgi:hypothetical protein